MSATVKCPKCGTVITIIESPDASYDGQIIVVHPTPTKSAADS